MKRLTAYVRRTIAQSAIEYAPRGKAYRGEVRREARKSAFRDATYGGTVSGWWNELIYNVDVLRLANFYRADIAASVRDYLSETGESLGNHCDRDQEFTWADVIAATGRRWSMDDYSGDNGRDKETSAMALCWGLLFAVEYIAGGMESEFCGES